LSLLAEDYRMKRTFTYFAFFLLISCTAHAYEIEERHQFQVTQPSSSLNIYSTTDLIYFEPLIKGFQVRNPRVEVIYTVLSSTALYDAVNDSSVSIDLAISSAMDLQMKLANDGKTLAYRSDDTDGLPAWAHWRDRVFAFTLEPAALLMSRKALEGLPLPRNRQELTALLRDNPERFSGRVGTYDIRDSGAGYLFATQDNRQSDAFWRLAEVMGGLEPKLYCCSGQMIEDIRSGALVMAYNVVGSYAAEAFGPDDDGLVVPLQDYTHVLQRTALIPRSASEKLLAGSFVDFLIGELGQDVLRDESSLSPVSVDELESFQYLRPIRLGPGLLVYLDKIKRQNFLQEWTEALSQPQ